MGLLTVHVGVVVLPLLVVDVLVPGVGAAVGYEVGATVAGVADGYSDMMLLLTLELVVFGVAIPQCTWDLVLDT